MTEGTLVPFSDPEWEGPDEEELAKAVESELSRHERRTLLEGRSARELAWFLGELGGKVPEEGSRFGRLRRQAETIRGWLADVPAAHRAVLERMFTPRTWPEVIERRFGSLASLVVRLECARHGSERTASTEGEASTESEASTGTEANTGTEASVEEVEAAAVRRLERKIADGNGDIRRLAERAELHERLALRAYITVRAHGRCLCPSDTQKAAVAREHDRVGHVAAVAEVAGTTPPANDVEAAGDVGFAPPSAGPPANDVEAEADSPPSSAAEGEGS
jgi:hypothetical protein